MCAVKCGSIEPAFITLLSFESGDQSGQSIYDLVYCTGLTVGLSMSDMMDWDIYRNMTLPVLYDKHLFMDFLTHYMQNYISVTLNDVSERLP